MEVLINGGHGKGLWEGNRVPCMKTGSVSVEAARTGIFNW